MFKQTIRAASLVTFALILVMHVAGGANARSKLPDPISAGVAEKL
jgi:hypothetical protein